MLSDKSRPVIEATLPVMDQHIQEIADSFYRHLFDTHAEMLDGVFNCGNQAEGTQEVALAGSVTAFATALVNTPDQLPEHLLARVGHKHASLGVEPEQYQIVHDALMWAIGDVLGDAVTPQIAAAWEEVYWLMAYTLIHIERGIYSASGVRPQTVWRRRAWFTSRATAHASATGSRCPSLSGLITGRTVWIRPPSTSSVNVLTTADPASAPEAIQAIRGASKSGLRELRAILQVLRQVDGGD